MSLQDKTVSLDVSMAGLKSLSRASSALTELAGAYIHRCPADSDLRVAGAYATVSGGGAQRSSRR